MNAATQPKITAKNNPFCKTLKPSVETLSAMGEPTGMTGEVAAAGAPVVFGIGISLSSSC